MDDRPDASSRADHPVDGGVLSAEAVEALIEETVERLVAHAAPDTVLGLLDLLEQTDSLWQAVLFLLGPFASRPLPGYDESQTVARLRELAKATPDPVSAMTFALRAEFRAHGTAAAREVWDTAPAAVRRGSAAQLLVQYASSIGADTGAISPKAVVRLLHATVPTTWLAHQA